MNKTRVEAFSDAVIAIIMTIMILEIEDPSSGCFGRFDRKYPIFFIVYCQFYFYLYCMVQSSLHNVRNSLVF